MPFRPPLTLNELRDVQSRHSDDADVRVLLWEVKRLRSLALAASQVLPMCTAVGPTAGMLRDALTKKLNEEACVIEHKARIEEALNPNQFSRTSEGDLGPDEPFRPSRRQ